MALNCFASHSRGEMGSAEMRGVPTKLRKECQRITECEGLTFKELEFFELEGYVYTHTLLSCFLLMHLSFLTALTGSYSCSYSLLLPPPAGGNSKRELTTGQQKRVREKGR